MFVLLRFSVFERTLSVERHMFVLLRFSVFELTLSVERHMFVLLRFSVFELTPTRRSTPVLVRGPHASPTPEETPREMNRVDLVRP